MRRPVEVTAHRGSSLVAPENSLPAIRRAMDDGADACEIDVQPLKDGTIVLIHDADLRRVARLDRRVGDLTYDDVRDVDTGSWFAPEFAAVRLPTLEQVVELVRGRMRLNIELKYHGGEGAFEEAVVAIVREANFQDQCILTSLEADGLRRIRAIAPELTLGQIVTESRRRVPDLPVDLLSMHAKTATPDRIRANRDAGLATHVWTVNDREEMQVMIDRGVDSIITDDPALLRLAVGAG